MEMKPIEEIRLTSIRIAVMSNCFGFDDTKTIQSFTEIKVDINTFLIRLKSLFSSFFNLKKRQSDSSTQNHSHF